MKQFHDELKEKMDNYAHLVYRATKNSPREEIYGITSQLRRSSLSVILNYIEGYARKNSKVYLNFLKISYGSLKESAYRLNRSMKERYLAVDEYRMLAKEADIIGGMPWSTIQHMSYKL